MTLSFHLSQWLYRTFFKSYLKFDGNYSIHDNVKNTSESHSCTIYAKDEHHANRILESYRYAHCIWLDKQHSWYGIKYKNLGTGKRGIVKTVAANGIGIANVKSNFDKGFNAGGQSPTALFSLLVDIFLDLAKHRAESKQQAHVASKKTLLFILFILATFCAAVVFLSLYLFLFDSLTLTGGLLSGTLLATCCVMLKTTYKLIEAYDE
jgi:hypothetical protein